MTPNANIQGILFRPEQLEKFCRRWNIAEMALFGSVVRDDFRPDSDIDILVTFASATNLSLDDREQMEDELSRLTGHRIDLVDRQAVERSENYIRRHNILSTAEPIYVAR